MTYNSWATMVGIKLKAEIEEILFCTTVYSVNSEITQKAELWGTQFYLSDIHKWLAKQCHKLNYVSVWTIWFILEVRWSLFWCTLSISHRLHENKSVEKCLTGSLSKLQEALHIFVAEPPAKMGNNPPASQPSDHLETTSSSFINTSMCN